MKHTFTGCVNSFKGYGGEPCVEGVRNDKTVVVGITLIIFSAVLIAALILLSLVFVLLGIQIGGKAR